MADITEPTRGLLMGPATEAVGAAMYACVAPVRVNRLVRKVDEPDKTTSRQIAATALDCAPAESEQ